jgi:hypothetical protein
MLAVQEEDWLVLELYHTGTYNLLMLNRMVDIVACRPVTR